MRKALVLAMGLVAAPGAFDSCFALDRAELDAMAAYYDRFLVIAEPDKPLRYMYADAGQHVHVFDVGPRRPELKWESVNLGARASGLMVRDLEKDGRTEMIVTTLHGRILIYDTVKFDLLWENLQDRFARIEAIAAEDLDRDPQDELIFVANDIGEQPRLLIYDSVNKSIEWESTREFTAQQILLANTDDDEQLEIILNTGFVIDSRFYNVEWESESRFGDRIRLMDVNGDDIPEVIGDTPDFTLRVFDIYAKREIW